MPKRQRTADSMVFYPDALRSAEVALLEARRGAAPDPDRDPLDDAVGFGLSGGGIRSATFCLGIFQALADAKLIKDVDFLSTVSGGGYFGAFLGRLFTRAWVTSTADVETVLRGVDVHRSDRVGCMAPRAFRWLRENGRYLAPRGSGDVLELGAVLLRNWIAVQVVFIATILTLFVGLQLLGGWIGSTLARTPASILPVMARLPFSEWLPWSPWILTVAIPLFLIVVPAGWSYWLVFSQSDKKEGWHPIFGVLTALVLSLITAAEFGTGHPIRLAVALTTSVSAVLAIVTWRVTAFQVAKKFGSAAVNTDKENVLRSWLSRWLTRGLTIVALLLAWALLDTVGALIYTDPRLFESFHGSAGAALGSLFVGIGAFARQLATLLAPAKPGTRPRISQSIVSWIAAVLVSIIWLVAIDVGSHAIAWSLKRPCEQSDAMAQPNPPLLGADHLQISPDGNGFVVRAMSARISFGGCGAQTAPKPSAPAVIIFVVLLGFTVMFGQTRTFANMSSIHAFYASRLTRTYLGASNDQRLGCGDSSASAKQKPVKVTDATSNDDCGGDSYFHWPTMAATPSSSSHNHQWKQGRPLHIVNTTINETVDTRTGLQNQDRKGTALAVGPCGLSVGVRDHLVASSGGAVAIPASGHCVFDTGRGASTPDPLSLGKWISVSGAAFSAAAGANTTVPLAILSGLFNVRLGYWWNSGTPNQRSWVEWALPVQTSLFSELLAQTHGTEGRLWNLSDGGHFENMGGYELIRRRLPLIVIIDAEADPDYTFEGLSDLIRKARLDFGAEVTFLSNDGINKILQPQLPGPDDPIYFGDLDALRRGVWTHVELPFPPAPANKQFNIDVERTRVSRSHASLARVDYADGSDPSWLLYVKASLMGEEPEDVRQYHRAHPDFPQESTTDQFFDERQWESYRRLGLHIGHRVLTERLISHLRHHPPEGTPG